MFSAGKAVSLYPADFGCLTHVRVRYGSYKATLTCMRLHAKRVLDMKE